MTGIVAMLDGRNWTAIAHELDVEGYALLPGLLTPAQARELANAAPATAPTARASASADSGELFGHAPTAPAAWMPWRKAFYRHLAPIANRWQQILDDPLRYPAELPEFLARNRAAGQTRPLSRLQRLRQGTRWACISTSTATASFRCRSWPCCPSPDGISPVANSS